MFKAAKQPMISLFSGVGGLDLGLSEHTPQFTEFFSCSTFASTLHFMRSMKLDIGLKLFWARLVQAQGQIRFDLTSMWAALTDNNQKQTWHKSLILLAAFHHFPPVVFNCNGWCAAWPCGWIWRTIHSWVVDCEMCWRQSDKAPISGFIFASGSWEAAVKVECFDHEPWLNINMNLQMVFGQGAHWYPSLLPLARTAARASECQVISSDGFWIFIFQVDWSWTEKSWTESNAQRQPIIDFRQ